MLQDSLPLLPFLQVLIERRKKEEDQILITTYP
jgi:hypothetical protein